MGCCLNKKCRDERVPIKQHGNMDTTNAIPRLADKIHFIKDRYYFKPIRGEGHPS